MRLAAKINTGGTCSPTDAGPMTPPVSGEMERRLHAAVRSGDAGLVEELLWAGADPDEPSWESSLSSPLLLAASLSRLPIVRLLCDHGCDMNCRTVRGETALHLLIGSKKNLAEGVRLLLDYGCDANIQENLYGQTPLHALVKQIVQSCDYSPESLSTLKYLLEKSDPGLGDHGKRTALHRAAYSKAHVSCVQALLECGPDRQNSRGETALHEALEADCSLDVLTFLAYFTDLRLQTNFGETPLHVAARKGREDAVRLLLDLDAPVDAQDLKGNTALHLAAERGLSGVVSLLTSRPGLSLGLQNLDGLIPLQAAVEGGFLPVVQIILNGDSSKGNFKTKGSMNPEENCRPNSQHLSSILFTDIKKREDKVI